MNKRLFFLNVLLISFILSASAGIKYTLTGKAPSTMEGKTIYLTVFAQKANTPIDSAVVSNGQFVLKGELESPAVGLLAAKKMLSPIDKRLLIVIEPGSISVDFSTEKGDIKGGILNERLNMYADSMFVLKQKRKESQVDKMMVHYNDSTTTDEQRKEALNLYGYFNKREAEIGHAIVDMNLDNVVGAFMFANYQNSYTEEEREKVLGKAGENFLNNPLVQTVIQQTAAVKKRGAGNRYIDFEQPDADGKTHKLSEYIGTGKYVLVDFWASWCGPCRAEMPNVKAAYDKYHSKGFEILSVSLDSKKDAWLKAIDQLGMTWHHLSDLQGWKNAAAQQYGIKSIPCTMLIGPDGIIVGGDYRGDELGNKLEELLK